jgi:hypothetical protein
VNADDGILAVYRAAQRLYPRAFCQEYGEDMALLLAEQLRDEPRWRVCGRGLVDLAVTLPTRHMEAHMSRSRTPALVLIVSLVVAAATFTFVEGSVGLAVAVLGTVLAMLIWRRERPAAVQRSAAANWWKLLGSGAALLALVVTVTIATGELSQATWFLAAAAFLASVTLLGAGAVLAVVRLTGRRGTPSPAP